VQQPDVQSISLQFFGYKSTDTVDFPLSFENMFYPSSGKPDDTIWYLAMSSLDGFGVIVIGNIAQADHYIETDLDNQKIGWTSRDCTLPM
jgi:hypothetical protein